MSRTIAVTDAVLGGRVERALRLAERASRDPFVGSPALAYTHLDRMLGRANPELVTKKARRTASTWRRLALAAAACGLLAVLVGPFRIAEGLDVLFARKGYAPIPLPWIDTSFLVGHPPAYLHQQDVVIDDIQSIVELPNGSLLTVRGDPIRLGRRLVLVDGSREVPFVDDASGGVVARWLVSDTTDIRIAARFGDVLVPQTQAIHLRSIPDEMPRVVLDGAPRILRLLEEPIVEIRYEVEDDHGLREIDLVFRSAGREERRVLARLDGEVRNDRGAHRVRATDPFFKRAYAPVELTVEARDNDPAVGPKWGRSASITVFPPLVGEPEALRYEAWKRLRNVVVDATAFRIDSDGRQGRGEGDSQRTARQEQHEHLRLERERAKEIKAELDHALDGSYGGLRLPSAIQMLARGQMRKLDEALIREERKMSSAAHSAHRKTTEEAALTLDSALRRLDVVDSTSVAKRLADVAEDAAIGASQAGTAVDRERGIARLDAAVQVLEGGGSELRRLGALGRDLGEIVANDLKRIRRTQAKEDYQHAELAAHDLAARLRRPAPSFGAGRRGGVETGGGSGGDEADTPDPSQQIVREQEKLEELARDHAGELAGVEQALSNGSSSEEMEAFRKEAKEHARSIREAVRELSRSGAEPGTSEAAASAAREHAEAMAEGLERGDPAGAVKSGRNAIDALGQAQRTPSSLGAFRSDDPHGDARRSADKLGPEVQWAEHALQRIRQAASRRAADDLKGVSEREQKLAERAQEIGKEGESGAAALPGSTLDMLEGAESAMREAARALGRADGDRALERQREAQRLLEMARSGDESAEQEEQEGDQGRRTRGSEKSGEGDLSHASIPRAEEYKGPEAFRRRVLEGLGGAADPRLRGAIQRYAEGLLR